MVFFEVFVLDTPNQLQHYIVWFQNVLQIFVALVLVVGPLHVAPVGKPARVCLWMQNVLQAVGLPIVLSCMVCKRCICQYIMQCNMQQLLTTCLGQLCSTLLCMFCAVVLREHTGCNLSHANLSCCPFILTVEGHDITKLTAAWLADSCTYPQVCNAAGQSTGTCIDPQTAGASCSTTKPGKLKAQLSLAERQCRAMDVCCLLCSEIVLRLI